jgi:hypothetical protein
MLVEGPAKGHRLPSLQEAVEWASNHPKIGSNPLGCRIRRTYRSGMDWFDGGEVAKIESGWGPEPVIEVTYA